MTDPPIVAVRGEAVREVPPELARLLVTVEARDGDRKRVLARLTERADQVRQLVDSYPEAVERQETGYLHVAPEHKRRGERVSGYRGRLSTMVVVTDFPVLGELMIRLADLEQSTVTGPWWELRPDSPVHREVRRAAVADAIARATDYAEAVGARLAAVREIADLGMAGRRQVSMELDRARAAGAADAGVPELDLDPQLQTVYGQVEARFEMTAPSLEQLAR